MSQGVSCIYHPQHMITNFCSDMKCLLPLCPECVRIHLQEHRKSGSYGDFDTIEEILDGTSHQIRLFDRINYLQKMQRDFQIDYFQKLNDAKIKMIQIVNEFFEKLEHDYFTEQVKKQEAKINLTAQTTLEKVFNQERYNEKYIDGLQDNDRSMNYIIKYYQEKIYEMNSKELQNVDQSIQEMESTIKDLKINEDEIQNIKNSLNNLLNFQTHKFSPDTPIYISPIVHQTNTGSHQGSVYTQNSPPRKPEALRVNNRNIPINSHPISLNQLHKSSLNTIQSLPLQQKQIIIVPPNQSFQSFSPRNNNSKNMTFVPLNENYRSSSPQSIRSNTIMAPNQVVKQLNMQSPSKQKENQNVGNIKSTWKFKQSL